MYVLMFKEAARTDACCLQPLTSLTNEQIVAELGWTREAIKRVLGVTPTTMRAPYGDMGWSIQSDQERCSSSIVDDRVRAISLAMGLTPILWTSTSTGIKFDTNGMNSRLQPIP